MNKECDFDISQLNGLSIYILLITMARTFRSNTLSSPATSEDFSKLCETLRNDTFRNSKCCHPINARRKQKIKIQGYLIRNETRKLGSPGSLMSPEQHKDFWDTRRYSAESTRNKSY